MAIASLDALVSALTSQRQKFYIAKATLGNQTIGGNGSWWRTTGNPAAAALPATPATCNNTTPGGLNYNNSSTGLTTYIGRASLALAAIGSLEIHDRLAHMGGLSGAVTTAQTAGLDLSLLLGTDNIAARITKADYSAVQWWLEWYVATGATTVNFTVGYTDQNGNSGKTVIISVPGSAVAASRLVAIQPLNGDFIRSIDSVTLAATTGAAGNFGVTATVQRTEISTAANILTIADWAYLGLPTIFDSSCLFFVSDNASATPGALNGAVTLVQG